MVVFGFSAGASSWVSCKELLKIEIFYDIHCQFYTPYFWLFLFSKQLFFLQRTKSKLSQYLERLQKGDASHTHPIRFPRAKFENLTFLSFFQNFRQFQCLRRQTHGKNSQLACHGDSFFYFYLINPICFKLDWTWYQNFFCKISQQRTLITKLFSTFWAFFKFLISWGSFLWKNGTLPFFVIYSFRRKFDFLPVFLDDKCFSSFLTEQASRSGRIGHLRVLWKDIAFFRQQRLKTRSIWLWKNKNNPSVLQTMY